MATFRVFKESGNFVTVHKNFITDASLSWKAKGILLYLLSRPDDWQVYEIELQKHALDGRDSVRSGMKELQDAGYIHKERIRDEKGHFKEYEYQVYEQPTYVGNSYLGKAYLGNSHLGKPDTTNNNSTNNNLTNNDSNILSGNPTVYPYEFVIGYLNRQTGKQYKSTTKKNQTVIRARTDEGFTLDDFKKVIDNKVGEWKGTDMEKYLRPETLFGTKFEGYLNQEVAEPSGNVLEQLMVEDDVDGYEQATGY
ncbi:MULTISPECIES: conserved phage C-terminal domain-containing protein [unclassified Staphylococcus]|uniref:conserved phage C-terminal domain-containing protein n=1 Tax=unclassified Staphylococcus TaxID=91994 RepID=UPI0021D1E6E0|nr:MULTISPECIES: conserved phage C-terminal domain-containing protein [unclassified Staphylococcus]UXR72336.1 conserved phage C-terminal domain-containing protein [Staphylococcus sp. IVB6240]UXR75625.1 conserved phage C-terminal domain-containing protein [Staphylococcus sp. IVB6233]UXR79825.1 conserved phage C-terminal domain-containing protein [Staphylococcus sp. IVB6218]